MRNIRRTTWAALAFALALSVTAYAPSGEVVAGRPCAEASDWVANNIANLPTSYSAISRFPAVYRRAVYAKLSATKRRELWATHLTEFLNPSAGLSAEQRKIVSDVITKLNRYLTDDVETGRKLAEADGHTPERIKALFGDTLSLRVFASLGPVTSLPGKRTVTSGRDSTNAPPPACDCSVQSPYCGGYPCYQEPDCEFGPGCGFLWCYACTGCCGGVCAESDDKKTW